MTDATFWRHLDALATRLEPAFAIVYRRVLTQLRSRLVIAPLVRMLGDGDIDRVLAYVFDTPEAKAILRELEIEYATAVVRTIPSVERFLPTTPGTLSLRVRAPVASPAITQAVRQWSDQSFKNVVAEMREGVRTVVAQGITDGLGPRAIAVALKSQTSAIGLTAYDESIIASFRAKLLAGDRSALSRALRDRRFDRTVAKGNLTPAQIDTMVGAYRRKLVALRAETFARTSAVQAANDANRATWQQAIDDGTYRMEEVKGYWIVADDERLCPRCKGIPALNDSGRRLDELFATTEDGDVQGPTIHPSCRCTIWWRHESPRLTPRPAPGTDRFIFTEADR